MSSPYANLRDKYVREKRPAVKVEVDLAAVFPPMPVADRPRMTAGERAYGLDLADWAPGLLHAWYLSRISGEWLGEVEVEARSSNKQVAVRLQTLVRPEHIRQATGQ